jgi:hypothetical protein
MIKDIIENDDYKEMIEGQLFELIGFLLNKEQEFNLTANIRVVEFDPVIPDAIAKNFQPFTLFALANYTYSTIELTDTHISFETGFGAENFGSVVTIPLYALFQVVVDESILFLNPSATVEKFLVKDDKKSQVQRSRSAFKPLGK